MTTTDPQAALHTALSAFQAEMPTVHKGKTARIPGKNGATGYSYDYADLGDVTAAAMPLLTKHGLAFACLPRMTPNGYELAGTLLHTGGGVLEGALPLHGRLAQEVGSSLTYMRRYLLGCMTGIVTDDDDDAQAAQPASRSRAWDGPTTAQLLNQIDADAQRAGVTYEQATARFRADRPVDWLDELDPWVVAPLAAQIKAHADQLVAQREAAAAEADKATAPVAGAGTAAGEAGDPWGPKDGATDA